MKKLDGWVFTYNIHIDKWMATKRDNYFLMFSDINNPLVLKSSSHATLIELIVRTGGEKTKLKEILKNGK